MDARIHNIIDNFRSMVRADDHWNSIFASEFLIRRNSPSFRRYCEEKVIRDHGLILSRLAFNLYLPLAEESAPRKDNITPREHHEESHVYTGNDILKNFGNNWIDSYQWGSFDAFVAAEILHDGVEDLGLSLKDIRRYLSRSLYSLRYNRQIANDQFLQAKRDIPQIVTMIRSLSRKNEKGVQYEGGDRIKQAKRLLDHPYCPLIKLIDWANKLQTIVGVDSFEDNDQKKLITTLDETALIYVDEQQALTAKAIRKWPKMKTPYQAMDGILGCQFQILRTYRQVRTGNLNFNPKEADPLNLKGYLSTKSLRLIRSLPKGLDYISPLVARLEEIGKNNTRVHDYVEYMVKPALPSLKPIKITNLKHVFHSCTQKAKSTINKIIGSFPASKL